jgi:3-oxoadipate enol-lactonase
MTRTHVSLGGRRLSFLDGDPGDAGNTIVFLHAFPLHAGMWAPQIQDLPAGWRAVAPDFRGFGLSEGDADGHDAAMTMDDYAADVAGLLDQLAISRAVCCGLSMGGYALFALLRRCPERIQGIVLADTRSAADTAAGVAGRQAMLERLAKDVPPAIAAQMLPGLLGESTRRERPAVVQDVARMLGGASATGIGGAVRRMMSRPDSTPLLASIACPTLVVVGDEDTLTPAADSRAMQAAIPGSTLTVIPAAGHLSNLERPDAFNGALWRFLGGLASERESRQE